MKYFDLTRVVTNAMPVYPGDVAVELHTVATIPEQGFTDHALHTSMHVGTHIDAPLHMIEGGKKISDYAPEKFFGRCCLVDARGAFEISTELVQKSSPMRGDIVIVFTDHARWYGEESYFKNYPCLTEDCARYLAETQVAIVGLDTPSPDTEPFLTHKILLSADILILENLMNLEALLGHSGLSVVALSVKIDADAGPVRVIAMTNGL